MQTWLALEAGVRALASVPGAQVVVGAETRTLLVAAASAWGLTIATTYHERRMIRSDGVEHWAVWAADTVIHRIGRCVVSLHCHRPASTEERARLVEEERARTQLTP